MSLLGTTLRASLIASLTTLLACAVETNLPDGDREPSGAGEEPGAEAPTPTGSPTGSPVPGAEAPGATPAGTASNPATPPGPPAPPAKFTGTATPEGCIQNVAPGSRTYTCEGLSVDATIPTMTDACPAAGCGLIVVLHGDTGSGPLMDAHLRLRERAAPKGYIVVAPTGPAIGLQGYPGSSWDPNQDAKVVAITRLFAKVFKADPKRVHATGFSRGAMMTWRLACDQSNLFASVAPGGAGNASTWLRQNTTESTCFTAGRSPARKLPILFLMGRTDVPIPYASMVSIRNAALADYGIAQNQVTTLVNDPKYVHARTNKPGAPIVEWLDHAYEINPVGMFSTAKGHCVPGSSVPGNAPQYAVACAGPNAFDWGAEVLAFFERTPMP